MDAQSSAISLLGSLDSLLVLLGESVQDRLFRIEERRPGSIKRSLLRTQGRLTGKLEHRDSAHLKVLMVGPVADSLARRIGEVADPESGVLSVVDFRLNRVSDSLRASAIAARGRVASQLNRAQTLIATLTNLQSMHAGLMGRLSGDVMIDQQVRREITDVENQMASVHREESQILEALRNEADELRQKIDAAVQMLGGYIRLGLISRTAVVIYQPKTIEQITQMSESERAGWWSELSPAEKSRMLREFPLEIGNLDGIPPDIKIVALEQYLLERASRDPNFRKELIDEGLMRSDGSLRTVYYFDPRWPESKQSVVVFGECQGWNHPNIFFEGTNSGAGTGPRTMELLEENHNTIAWKAADAHSGCIRTFLVRGENAKWGSRLDWAKAFVSISSPPAMLLKKILSGSGFSPGTEAWASQLPITNYGVERNTEMGVGIVNGLRANGGAGTVTTTGHSHGNKSSVSVGVRVGADNYVLLETAPLGDLYTPKNGAVVTVIKSEGSSFAGDIWPNLPRWRDIYEEGFSDIMHEIGEVPDRDGVTTYRPVLPRAQDGNRSGPWDKPSGIDHSLDTFLGNHNHAVTYRMAVRGLEAPDF